MLKYRIVFFVLFCSIAMYAQSKMICGIDISSLQMIENNSGIFKENGVTTDALELFKNHGVTYIRLRLWNNPSGGYSNIDSTIRLAKRVKQLGMKWLLDFHYSDTWADPGQQIKPAAWTGISNTALNDSVYTWTKTVLLTLQYENVLPEIVQIGNEITGGLLWNDGKVGGAYDTPAQWAQCASLLKNAIHAVDDINNMGSSIKTMVHIDAGGDTSTCKWFFDNLTSQNVQFNYIGLSYYPWWHGNLKQLTANVNMLALRYQKGIIIAETAYPWTLSGNDSTNNIIGLNSVLLDGYTATVEGQKIFLNAIKSIINNVPDSKGIGFFYWEPDLISTPSLGSSWENLSLFDFSGEVLKSIQAFEEETIVRESTGSKNYFALMQNYPNPFNPVTNIRYEIKNSGRVTLTIHSILGEIVATLVHEDKAAGYYDIPFNGASLATGVYYYKLQMNGQSLIKKLLLLK